MKRHYQQRKQSIEWEKILANYIFNKGLLSRIQREFLKLNNKKQATNSKMGKKLEKIFSLRSYTNSQ